MTKDLLNSITVVESSEEVWFPVSRKNRELQHVSQSDGEILEVPKSGNLFIY